MQAPEPAASQAVVYYNSACPVCDAGVRGQRERMQGCAVEWRDVNAEPGLAAELGIDIEALRERLHVRDASGRMLVGDQAFAALWGATPGQRSMARLIRPLRWLTGPLYKVFARLLYRWNRRRGNW
jgi:predicted DCC family thiol-disulfide oxidoreductase YuxK